jgi:hypothetical protein
MNDNCKCRGALDGAFQEAALALGGVVASSPILDEAIWDLARALDQIHERASERCGATQTTLARETEDPEHPAIVHLLTRLRDRGAARGGACGSCRGQR